jgi:hypothetical protein
MAEYNDYVKGVSPAVKQEISEDKIAELEVERSKAQAENDRRDRLKTRDVSAYAPVEHPALSGIMWSYNTFFGLVKKNVQKEWTAEDGFAYRLNKSDIDAIAELFEDQIDGAYKAWRTAENIEVKDLP